jgi:Flp pilus assembly pilin Flp
MRRDRERGANLIEYMLLVFFIALACLVAVTYLGESRDSVFDRSGSSIANASP